MMLLSSVLCRRAWSHIVEPADKVDLPLSYICNSLAKSNSLLSGSVDDSTVPTGMPGEMPPAAGRESESLRQGFVTGRKVRTSVKSIPTFSSSCL